MKPTRLLDRAFSAFDQFCHGRQHANFGKTVDVQKRRRPLERLERRLPQLRRQRQPERRDADSTSRSCRVLVTGERRADGRPEYSSLAGPFPPLGRQPEAVTTVD